MPSNFGQNVAKLHRHWDKNAAKQYRIATPSEYR